MIVPCLDSQSNGFQISEPFEAIDFGSTICAAAVLGLRQVLRQRNRTDPGPPEEHCVRAQQLIWVDAAVAYVCHLTSPEPRRFTIEAGHRGSVQRLSCNRSPAVLIRQIETIGLIHTSRRIARSADRLGAETIVFQS